MSKRTKTTAIGAFVVLAIAIFLVALVAFGSGKILSPTFKFVSYFDGRLKGLKVGSKVMYRGVTIGSVREITINIDNSTNAMNIPVVFEIELDKISSNSSQFKNVVKARQALWKLIEDEGLRARLSIDSIVTGQLVIELDYEPDSELRLVAPGKLPYPEFPTVQSTVEQVAESFREVPVKEMAATLQRVINGLDKRVNDPNLQRAMESLDELMAQYTEIGRRLNNNVLPRMTVTLDNINTLSEAVKNDSLKRLNSNMDTADDLMQNMNSTLPEFAKQISEIRDSFSRLSEAACGALANIEKISDGNSAVVKDFRKMLKEFADAARSIEQTADFLQRHPQAILQGKEMSDGY